MNGYDDGQELIEALETLEQTLSYEEDDETMFDLEYDDTEARRRRPARTAPIRSVRRPTTSATTRPATTTRPANSYVTQTQFTLELQKVRAEVKKSADDVTKAINATISRINAVNKAQDTRLNNLDARQKRDNERLRRQMKQSQEMFMMMTLLQDKPKLKMDEANKFVTGYDADAKDSMLPVLLLTGMGSDEGKDGSQDSSSMNTILLALAFSGKL